MLTERQEERVTILPDGRLEVKEETIIERDGIEINRSFLRYVVDVGDDVTNKPAFVREIAAKMHTAERINARKTKKDAQK